MMKKVLITLMILVSSIFMISQNINAFSSFIDEPSSNTGGLWHVEDGNRAYIFMRYTHGEEVFETGSSSNETHPEYDLSLYTIWWGLSDELAFPNTTTPNTASISNPNPDIYDKFVIEIIAHMEAPAAEHKIIETYDGIVDTVEIDLHQYRETGLIGDFSYITMFVDGEQILSSRALSGDYAVENDAVNPNRDDLYFGVKMYWEQSEVATTIDPTTSEDPWSALPETEGSPANPIGDWGSLSDISVVNQKISFTIDYLGTSYPVAPFIVEGDLDFINKANDVLYYTEPSSGDKILYFNFGDTLDSAILTARSFSEVNEWKGEALWNLTKNEIKVTDVLTVYNYIPEVDEDGNVYSYFYMPDVPMDNLISVSAVLAYRYWDDGFLNLGDLEPGEVQYKTVAAVRGETTSVNPTWVETAYTTAYIAGALVVAGTVSGLVPVYGWPIAIGCFVTAGVLTAADINEWFAYDIDQIERVIPSVALVSEINSYISEQSGSDQFTVDTDKLYKLHLATLQEGDEVQIMDELSNVTQVVWESDGEIYVVNQDSIDNITWGGPGTLEPQDTIGNSDLELVLYVGGGILALIFISKMKLDKKPGLLVLIVGAAVYLLYSLGMI